MTYRKISGIVVSSDPGSLVDKSAIAVVVKEDIWNTPAFDPAYIGNSEYQVVATELLPMQTDYQKQVDYIINLCDQLKRIYGHTDIDPVIVLDAGGVGLPILDLMRERVRLHNNHYAIHPMRYSGGFYPSDGKKNIRNIPKAEVFNSLVLVMQDMMLKVVDPGKHASVLKTELQNFKITYRESGITTMEAGRGHDDMLCAVANGVYDLQKGKKGPVVLPASIRKLF